MDTEIRILYDNQERTEYVMKAPPGTRTDKSDMQSVSELKAVIDVTFEDITESFGMICMEEKRTPLSIKRFCNNVEALKTQLSKLQLIIQNEELQRCS